MFDYKHYVPILKGKEGEFGALQNLSPATKANITPLIEIPPIPWDFQSDAPAKTVNDHLERTPERLAQAWGTTQPMFIDLGLIPSGETMADGSHPLEWLFRKGMEKQLQLIPVIGLLRDYGYRTAVQQAILQDGRGVALRLEGDDFEDSGTLEEVIDEFLDDLGIAPADVDLIVDFKEMLPNQTRALTIAARSVLGDLPHIQGWRSITLAGSSFPSNLAGLSAGSADLWPRVEWAVWTEIVNRPRSLKRLPAFADYAIQHPEPAEVDPRIMRMSANLRYTAASDWLLMKGRNVRDHGFEQFVDLCRELVKRVEYRGAGFSWGDQRIQECADGRTGTGNATTWRRVGTNHHIAVVRDQIASLP